MHAIILAGGKGLRLRELTHARPKGLLQLGDHTIIDDIIFHLNQHGVESITVAAGYRAEDFESHFKDKVRSKPHIQVIDTGLNTNTGGRLTRLQSCLFDSLDDTESLIICYSDGLSDINLTAVVAQHEADNKIVTVTAVHPPARFGELQLDDNEVINFAEKQPQTHRWINGGYFVTNKSVLRFLNGDDSSWENDVLVPLSENHQLGAYRHHGAWQCMDTQQDLILLNQLLDSDQAFWPIKKSSA